MSLLISIYTRLLSSKEVCTANHTLGWLLARDVSLSAINVKPAAIPKAEISWSAFNQINKPSLILSGLDALTLVSCASVDCLTSSRSSSPLPQLLIRHFNVFSTEVSPKIIVILASNVLVNPSARQNMLRQTPQNLNFFYITHLVVTSLNSRYLLFPFLTLRSHAWKCFPRPFCTPGSRDCPSHCMHEWRMWGGQLHLQRVQIQDRHYSGLQKVPLHEAIPCQLRPLLRWKCLRVEWRSSHAKQPMHPYLLPWYIRWRIRCESVLHEPPGTYQPSN